MQACKPLFFTTINLYSKEFLNNSGVLLYVNTKNTEKEVSKCVSKGEGFSYTYAEERRYWPHQ